MKQKITLISEAVAVIENDGIVIHETDTVSGVSGKYDSLKAYNLIYKIKEREKAKPLAILISEFSEIEKFTNTETDKLLKIVPLLEKGMTILLPIKKGLPAHLANQSEFIGLRIPNHPATKEIIKKVGPLICTSANISGSDPVISYEEALPLLKADVYYLEGKGQKKENHSTILRYENGNYSLIREGNVCKEEINMHVTLSFNNSLC